MSKRQAKFTLISILLLEGIGCNAALGNEEERRVLWAGAVYERWSDSQDKLFDNTLKFALGTFGEEFRPDETNLVEWVANWKTLDTSSYNAEYGYFTSGFRLGADYTSSGTGAVPDEVFAVGEQVYVWVYQDGQELTSSPDEWALVRNDEWTVPKTENIITLPLQWNMAFGKQEAVLGSPGRTVEVMLDQATGYVSVGELPSALPVPEPGGGVLVMLSLLMFSAMRKR